MIYFCMVMNRALEKIDKICQMDDSKIDEILSCTNIREMETKLESYGLLVNTDKSENLVTSKLSE